MRHSARALVSLLAAAAVLAVRAGGYPIALTGLPGLIAGPAGFAR